MAELEVVPAALRVMSMTAVLSSSARVWRARKIGVKGPAAAAGDAGFTADGAASVPMRSPMRSPSQANTASATGRSSAIMCPAPSNRWTSACGRRVTRSSR